MNLASTKEQMEMAWWVEILLLGLLYLLDLSRVWRKLSLPNLATLRT